MLRSETQHNSVLIRLETVPGDLKATTRCVSQLLSKSDCIGLCAASQVEGKNQFAIALNRGERPSVQYSVIFDAFASFGLLFSFR